ncbi:hypothetical protein BJ508DRAFT_328522 [Ascobolus immersus RN42]|uniref:Uncharacterized protein n=1 Tax=Ascobolus immersus RN42 TaxID=1160509 RepID=A0A3N4I1H7_ASCIM|nr:hypothetical protein BJ508DRAFT_328522 [Ascobolus immersus RN42]
MASSGGSNGWGGGGGNIPPQSPIRTRSGPLQPTTAPVPQLREFSDEILQEICAGMCLDPTGTRETVWQRIGVAARDVKRLMDPFFTTGVKYSEKVRPNLAGSAGVRALATARGLSEAGPIGDVVDLLVRHWERVLDHALAAHHRNGLNQQLADLAPDDQMPPPPGPQQTNRRRGEWKFPTDGDLEPHIIINETHMPGKVTSRDHRPANPLGIFDAAPGYKTRYYIIKDHRHLANTTIRLIHPYGLPEEARGNEEARGQFQHSQFQYDRVEDFPRGISPDQHGGRGADTKKTTFPPNAAVARAKLGLVDSSFFPVDSAIAQNAIQDHINLQENKKLKEANQKTKKLTTVLKDKAGAAGQNLETDRFGDDVLPIVEAPESYTGEHSATGKERQSSNKLYNMFRDQVTRVLIRKNIKAGSVATMTEDAWIDLCVDILLEDESLPDLVREDLLFGVHEDVLEVDVQATTARNLALAITYSNQLSAWADARDQGTQGPRPQRPADEEVRKTVQQRLVPADQMWHQMRRFLWPALRFLVKGCIDSSIQAAKETELYLKARKEYSDYWAPSPYAKALLVRPSHPHFIDIKVRKGKRGAEEEEEEAGGNPGTAVVKRPRTRRTYTSGASHRLA